MSRFCQFFDAVEYFVDKCMPYILAFWAMGAATWGGIWLGTTIRDYNYFSTQVQFQQEVVKAQFYAGAISEFAAAIKSFSEAK